MKLFRIELKPKTEPKPPQNPALGIANVDPAPIAVYPSGPRGSVWITAYTAFEAMSIFVQKNGPDIVSRFDSMYLVADTNNSTTEEYFLFNNE